MASRPPTPGCLIGVAGLIVFGLITIWTVYTGYTQNKEIERFTTSKPADLAVSYRDAEAVVGLRHRVREFGDTVSRGQPGQNLELSVADLNDLVGHEDRLFDFREMVAFKSIDSTIEARIAFPMQTLFQGGRFRYLNGTVAFKPTIEEGQVMLKIVDLKPDVGGAVPDGFFNFISGNVNLMATLRDDKQLEPIFSKIHSIRTEPDKVIIETR